MSAHIDNETSSVEKKTVVKGMAEIISKKQNRTTNHKYYLKWKENVYRKTLFRTFCEWEKIQQFWVARERLSDNKNVLRSERIDSDVRK